MIELSIHSTTYAARTAEETFKSMSAQGIFRTQFNLASAGMPTLPDHMDEGKIQNIKNVSAAYGVTLEALSGTFNMIDLDEDARRRGCEQFETQCDIARRLGIPIITLCTGSKNPAGQWIWHDDNEKESSWDDLMRSTEIIIKYAGANKIVLGVETEASNVINTPEKARKYLDAVKSPYLKIIMDPVNLFRPEQVSQMRNVIKNAFDLLGNDIVLAHAKDLTMMGGKMKFAAAGEGILDFGYCIELLDEWGYSGGLVMHGLSEAQVPGSRDFLGNLIARRKS